MRLYQKSTDLIGPTVLIGAGILWIIGIRQINPLNTNDYGLVSVFSAPVYAALSLMMIGFGFVWWQGHRWLMFTYVLVLIVMLYGLTPLIYALPRTSTTWVHAGFTEYIMRTGHIDGMLDARFSWPGFFTLSAFVTQCAGLQSVLAYADWAFVFFNLLYLGPLYLIFRSFSDDDRLIWLAIWFYYVANWVGQDYFSPQALNCFFFLVILAILLKWFNAGSPVPGQRVIWQRFLPDRASKAIQKALASSSLSNSPSTPWQRAALFLFLFLLVVAATVSHQLIPFIILASTSVLVLFGRSHLWELPLLGLTMILAWMTYVAYPFMAGNFKGMLMDVLSTRNLLSFFSHNIANRVQGSQGHLFVVQMRLLITLAIWSLAGLGFLRRIRSGHWDLACFLLLISPFPLILLQSYGGEMLMRVYFIGLPFAAFLVAALLRPNPQPQLALGAALSVVAVSSLLMGGFLFARYGNERMDYFTPLQVEGFEYLYRHAPQDSTVLSYGWSDPRMYRNLELIHFEALPDQFGKHDVWKLVDYINEEHLQNVYVVLTRSQAIQGELFGGLPVGWQDRMEQSIMASNRFALLYANTDFTLYRYLGAGE
jgi:hypothetical protein